jgi:hypothetical protein
MKILERTVVLPREDEANYETYAGRQPGGECHCHAEVDRKTRPIGLGQVPPLRRSRVSVVNRIEAGFFLQVTTLVRQLGQDALGGLCSSLRQSKARLREFSIHHAACSDPNRFIQHPRNTLWSDPLYRFMANFKQRF